MYDKVTLTKSCRLNTPLVVVVSKKCKKKLFSFFFYLYRHGFGKNVAIFDWEWGRNSAPGEGQKMPL